MNVLDALMKDRKSISGSELTDEELRRDGREILERLRDTYKADPGGKETIDLAARAWAICPGYHSTQNDLRNLAAMILDEFVRAHNINIQQFFVSTENDYEHYEPAHRWAAVDRILFVRSSVVEKVTKKKTTKGTINMRMMDAIQEDQERMSWNTTDWQKYLKCKSKSAITDTPTWKNLEMSREKEKAERKTDRRQRKRHYGNDD